MCTSPDLIIESQFCGITFVEITCPNTIRDENPFSGNLKKLQETDNGISLKTNHAHYHLIQGQLGVTNTAHSWYFVLPIMAITLKKQHLKKRKIFTQNIKTDTNPSSSHSTCLSLENSCDWKQGPPISSKVIALSKVGEKALPYKTR